MASLERYRTADGERYRVRWRFRGRARQQGAIPDRRTAVRIKREVEAATALGQDWRPARHTPADLSAAIEAYLGDAKRRGLALTTRTTYWYCLERFERFARSQLRRTPTLLDLSRVLVEDFHGELLTSQTERSAALAVGTVMRAWRWLYQREEFEEDTPRPRDVQVAAGTQKKVGRAPPWAVIDAMISADRSWSRGPSGHGWRVVTLVLQRYLGIRVSQAFRVEWRDFDLDARAFTLRPELGKTKAEKRGRTVPMPVHLAEYLAALGRREGFVVPARKNGARPKAMGQRLWRRAGIDPVYWEQQTTHALRHGFCTALRAAGVDRLVVEKMVGHQPKSTTDATYVDAAALWGLMVEAMALVPKIGTAGVVVQIGAKK